MSFHGHTLERACPVVCQDGKLIRSKFVATMLSQSNVDGMQLLPIFCLNALAKRSDSRRPFVAS